MKGWIQGILFLMAAALAAYIIWSGLLNPVTVRRENWNPIPVVYAIHTGPYRETGKIMDEVHDYLLERGVIAGMGAGIYFDDPSKLPAEGLRSVSGCVVNENFNADILLGSDYRFVIIPSTEYVASSFPYRGMLSIYLGIRRVYPRMEKYAGEHSISVGPALEIYDMAKERTSYLMPLDPDLLQWKNFQDPSGGI